MNPEQKWHSASFWTREVLDMKPCVFCDKPQSSHCDECGGCPDDCASDCITREPDPDRNRP